MEEKLQELKVQVLEELATIGTVSALKDMKVKYLGKKGSLTEIMRGMGKLSPEERPIVGQMVNEIRGQLETTIEERSKELEKAELIAKLANEKIDITLPGRKPKDIDLDGRHAVQHVRSMRIEHAFGIACCS